MQAETVKEQSQINDGTYLQLARLVIEMRIYQKEYDKVRGGYDITVGKKKAETAVDALLNKIYNIPIIK